MDWTAVGVIVAMVGVITSSIVAVRGQHQERKFAEATASRAEAAAALTEEYTSRLVDAVERMAAGGPLAPPPEPEVKWTLERVRDNYYQLTNVGGATAYQVKVTSAPTLIVRNQTEAPELAPNEACQFLGLATMQTRDRTITVTWRDINEQAHEWRYPLPR